MQKNKTGAIALRKQLAKKLINYYDELKAKTEAEVQDRSRSNSKTRSKVFIDEPTKQLSYHDDIHRKLKLLKVKDTMLQELRKSNVDGALDYEDPEFSKTHNLGKSGICSSSQLLRNSSIEAKPVDEIIKDKVEEAQQLSPFISGDEVEHEEEGGTKDGLFHLDIEHIGTYKDSKDNELFDHHQRKSKEIRRIQYWADLDRKKKRSGEKKPIQFKEDLENYDDEPRSDPNRKFPIWTVIKGQSIPSLISSPFGFALSPDGKNIEIREGDKVFIDPKNKGTFKPISGIVHKPSRQDGDADFAVIDPNSGRFPIQITERRKKRDVPNTNCTLYDSKGNRLGRANVTLSETAGRPNTTIPFQKAVLLDQDSNLSLVLVKMLRPNWVSYKDENGNQSKDKVIKEDTAVIGNHKVRCLTLEPKKDEDDPDFPRVLYIFGKKNKVDNHPIFEGEHSVAFCEDGQNYKGPLKVLPSDNKTPDLLYIRKESGKDDTIGDHDYVNVDLDEKCPHSEIDDLLNHMQDLANKRRDQKHRANEKPREGLDFRIVDKKGRKLRVKITDDNDDDFEPAQDEEDEEEEPQAIYYRLEYDGQQLTPLNVMKKVSQNGTSPRKSKQSPDRRADPYDDYEIHSSPDRVKHAKYVDRDTTKTRGDPHADSASTFKTGREQPNKQFLTASGKKQSVRATTNEEDQPRRSNSNVRIKMDVADGETRTVDVVGEGNVYFNQRNSPIRMESLGYKQEKLSEQVKRIENKAANDIQVFLRYCVNKPKFRRNNSRYLPGFRRTLDNPRHFRKFVAYYMDLPPEIDIQDAFSSYVEVLRKGARHY